MDPTIDVAKAIEEPANALLATKYVAAAGLVSVLYDHLLSSYEEFAVVWKRPKWDITSILFVFNRYGVEASLIYVAYMAYDQISTIQCKNFIAITSGVAVLSMAIANIFMVIRHYFLWDGNKTAVYAIIGAFILTYGTTLAFTIVSVTSMHQHMSYSPIVRTCVIDYKPPAFLGVWCGTVAFDFFTIALTVGNALERPHRQSVRLIAELNRDGAFFFIALFCLRLLNLVLSIVLGAQHMFLIVFFVWAMVSMTMSRLILRVEILKAKAGVSPWTQSTHLYDEDDLQLMPIHNNSRQFTRLAP